MQNLFARCILQYFSRFVALLYLKGPKTSVLKQSMWVLVISFFPLFFKKKTIETKINESFCIIKCKRLKYFIIKKMAGLDVWHLELLRPGVQKSKDDFIMSTDFKL